MSRQLLWVVPALAGVATLAGLALDGLVALPLSIAAAVVVAWWLWARDRRKVQRIADQVNRWVGKDRHDPVDLGGGSQWDQLAIALNALGSAHDQRGARLRAQPAWRVELISALVGPALLFSPSGRLLAANREAEELFGIQGDDDTLGPIQALGSPALAAAVRQVESDGGPIRLEAEVGEALLEATVSTLGEDVLVMATDRTEQRRTEELRRNFVVNASHELKTPAAGIHSLSEALDVVVERDPGRAHALVRRLHDEADRLVRLVHDLLDLRRLEDREAVDHKAVDVVRIARDVIAAADERAGERDIEVGLAAPETAMVLAQIEDVKLTLQNLILNAIQYNVEGGRVDVAVRTVGDHAVIEVADTGIGIPRQDLRRIFERFYRVDVARSRETGGTGLGLSIVRHAVERHGGTIDVDSLLGEGTTFRVELPLAPSDRAA